MSSLSSIYIKKETLKTLLDTLGKKGEKGIEFTISINEEANEYDQNLSAYVAQTKEARDEGKKRFYVGNGKVFWTDGVIKSFKEIKEAEPEPLQASPVSSDEEDDDLPF
tara:strand:- start:32569 stop:32895 length:327 start_codon:yes stop_codon:yes gene_type:complete